MNLPAPFTENQNIFFRRCFKNWFNVAEGGKRGEFRSFPPQKVRQERIDLLVGGLSVLHSHVEQPDLRAQQFRRFQKSFRPLVHAPVMRL